MAWGFRCVIRRPHGLECGPFCWEKMNGAVALNEIQTRHPCGCLSLPATVELGDNVFVQGCFLLYNSTHRRLFEEALLVDRVWWPGGCRVSRVNLSGFGRP